MCESGEGCQKVCCLFRWVLDALMPGLLVDRCSPVSLPALMSFSWGHHFAPLVHGFMQLCVQLLFGECVCVCGGCMHSDRLHRPSIADVMQRKRRNPIVDQKERDRFPLPRLHHFPAKGRRISMSTTIVGNGITRRGTREKSARRWELRVEGEKRGRGWDTHLIMCGAHGMRGHASPRSLRSRSASACTHTPSS